MKKLRFLLFGDRVSPEMIFTHWMLHIPCLARWLCRKKFANIGSGAEVRPGAYIIGPSRISLGANVVIRPGTNLFAKDPRPIDTDNDLDIIIEDGVLIGGGVHIYVSNHRFDNPKLPIIDQGYADVAPVKLMKGCWIGAQAIILPGVTIGEGSVVGAGAVVTKDVPAGKVVVGNPASDAY